MNVTLFQSLLFWMIGSGDAINLGYWPGLVFQSLLFWMIGSGSRRVSAGRGRKRVSILVVLDDWFGHFTAIFMR